jgi:hypothetical protein
VARAACPCENAIMGGPPMTHFIPKQTRAKTFHQFLCIFVLYSSPLPSVERFCLSWLSTHTNRRGSARPAILPVLSRSSQP